MQHARAELLEYLKSADLKLPPNPVELEFLIHFIFDDHDFVPSSTRLVGSILLDTNEASAVDDFVGALDCAIGPRDQPIPNLSERDWSPVRRAARVALTLLVRSGEAKYTSG